MFSINLIIFWLVLLAVRPTRKIALALVPWLAFAVSYDSMRFFPNYEFRPIDIRGLFEAERSLFGITTATGTLIPGEGFSIHNCAFADFMAGFFYLCWVPVPLGFAIYLYLKGKREDYIHPAAPPWYAINYGFEPILNTPGNVAGLDRFDTLVGFPVFHSIYCNNSNVFAAVPSLHAAYMLVTTIYAVKSREHLLTVCVFAFICMGIWWTAVYSTHHYIIDVLLGILTTIIAVAMLEGVIFRVGCVKRGMEKYIASIKN